MKHIPIPIPFIPLYVKARLPKEALHLVLRLLKFCDTVTPEEYRKQGDKWGEGQVQITGRDGTIYRGQIAPPREGRLDLPWVYNPHEKTPTPIPPEVLSLLPFNYPTLPGGHPKPNAGGLFICVQCTWIAKKHIGMRMGQWDIRTPVLNWELIPYSSSLSLPIEGFYQDKSYQKDRVLHPKHLFFRTDRKELGYFAQRHDAENIQLKDGVFIDTLHPSA